MINLELYKIFAIVAKEKNITRASEIMNISQPAVTKHIKNLENQLNVTLFERKNGMKLTIKGKELFENIYPEIEKLIKAEEELTGNRKINFGTYNTMVTTMFSESISKYYKENKNRKINVINLNIPSMFSMLENLELDLIVCKKVDEKVYDKTKIKYIKLGEMENVLIASKSSQLAKNVLV